MLGFVALVLLAGLTLPASAWVVEALADRAENWIFVLQLAFVFLVAAIFRLRGRDPEHRARDLATAFGLAVAATVIADGLWLLATAG